MSFVPGACSTLNPSHTTIVACATLHVQYKKKLILRNWEKKWILRNWDAPYFYQCHSFDLPPKINFPSYFQKCTEWPRTILMVKHYQNMINRLKKRKWNFFKKRVDRFGLILSVRNRNRYGCFYHLHATIIDVSPFQHEKDAWSAQHRCVVSELWSHE